MSVPPFYSWRKKEKMEIIHYGKKVRMIESIYVLIKIKPPWLSTHPAQEKKKKAKLLNQFYIT